MNQHFISQFLIKKWLQEDTEYLNVYDIQKGIFINKNSKNPYTTKGLFSSNQITKHEKILNESSEEKINRARIEENAIEIIRTIINKGIPSKIDMNRLGKYFQLFSLLSASYYWGDSIINQTKLDQYVDGIITNNGTDTNFLIMEKKSSDDDIILSINSFLYRYGDVSIFPVSPNIIIALGDELPNSKVQLSSNKISIFNSDFAKIEFNKEKNNSLFPYIVFRNNSYENIKKLLIKPQQGLKCILRIDEEQICELEKQDHKWINGEYLFLLGEKGLLPFSKYF
jgi:hypothetical protein